MPEPAHLDLLVVDDDDEFRDTLARRFSRVGFQVSEAAGGEQALEMVQPCRYFVMPYNPTAENMAKYLLEEMCPAVLEGSGATACRVRIWETDESYAEASVDAN